MKMIDSRNVKITNKAKIDQDIADYWIDSDFIKVRVKGEFPSMGSTQFIATDIVEAAIGRTIPPASGHQLVLGVDVARYGKNDTVIYPRCGKDARSFNAKRFNGLRTTQVTQKIIEEVQYFAKLGQRVAAIFVDAGGVGGGVADQLRELGYPVHDILFGGKPVDGKTYRFRSDEMWDDEQWLTDGGCIPRCRNRTAQSKTQLTNASYAIH